MNSAIIALIENIAWLFTYIVIAWSFISFFLPPNHPVREALDRIVGPFVEPIRRIMPQTGALDFSPMVLILIIWALSRFLIVIFSS